MHRPISKPQPTKFDLSAIRAHESYSEKVNKENSKFLIQILWMIFLFFFQLKTIQIPDSIVPDEYKVVRNQGVWPLQYDDT